MPDVLPEKFDPKKVMEAVNALMEKVESKSSDSAESKEATAKIEAFLAEQEAKSAEKQNEINKANAEKAELKERLDDLEKKAMRPDLKTEQKDTIESEIKAVAKYLSGTEIGEEERKYLRTDSDADGGYLVEGELDRQILKNITEISPIRNIARVRTLRGKALGIPRRLTLLSAYWTAEGKPGTESESDYGQEEIRANKMTAFSVLTTEAMQDAAFDLEGLIREDTAEAFAKLEGTAFVSGDGVKRPEGFVNTDIITPRNSGVANDVTIDSIIEVTGDLKTGYNPLYTMNRTTIANLRLKKAGDGHYLWQAGNIAAGVPNQIAGHGYVEVPDMADIAANAIPIAFGDFRRGYTIVDKPGMVFVRDVYTMADSGKIKLVFHRRTGGGLVLPEAIKLLKCAA